MTKIDRETAREKGLERQSGCKADINHPYFLHLRSLIEDLQKAASHAHGKLLDIGCGNKPYEEMFAGRISEYVGCDIVQSSQNRVDVISPATAIPLSASSFDTVLCTQVIEHIADHRGLLHEAFRLLKDEGILILSGPMYWPLHEEPYDFFRFTEHGFRYLLETTGFTIKTIESNGGKWATCGQVLIHTIYGTRLGFRIVIRNINRVFGYLDGRRKIGSNPMNYVIVAQKPGKSPTK